MNQVSTLITQSRERRGLNKSQAAKKLGISSQLLGQYESASRLPKTGFFLKWKQVFGEDLMKQIETNVSHEANKLEEAEVDYSQPIINVVLNLSYIGKKNADSMDKMAATNQQNTEIIAALVASMLPNSKFAQKLAASLSAPHTDEGLSAEDFLPKNTGVSPAKDKQSGKPVLKGK